MKNEKQLLLYSLLLGLLYNFLFYNKTWGISFPLFIGCIFLFFISYIKSIDLFKKEKTWYISIFIGLLSFNFFLSKNIIFRFFNFILIILLFVSMSLLLIKKEKKDWDKPSFFKKIIPTIFSPFEYFSRPYQFIYRIILSKKEKKEKNETIRKVLIGLLISFPILFILISLLASADMIFHKMLQGYPNLIATFFKNKNFSKGLFQVILILFVATYAYSYICSLFLSSPNQKKDNLKEELFFKKKKIKSFVILLF